MKEIVARYSSKKCCLALENNSCNILTSKQDRVFFSASRFRAHQYCTFDFQTTYQDPQKFRDFKSSLVDKHNRDGEVHLSKQTRTFIKHRIYIRLTLKICVVKISHQNLVVAFLLIMEEGR